MPLCLASTKIWEIFKADPLEIKIQYWWLRIWTDHFSVTMRN